MWLVEGEEKREDKNGSMIGKKKKMKRRRIMIEKEEESGCVHKCWSVRRKRCSSRVEEFEFLHSHT